MSDKAELVQRFERISDWLYGGDYEIECRKVSAVIAKYRHTCHSIYHGNGVGIIEPGTLCIVERAKVDGKFGSCYTCEPCIARAERETR